MTKSEYQDYEKSVEQFFKCEGVRNLSTGLLNCPQCKIPFECGECPQCHQDSGHFPCEPFVSGCPCDCCKTSLAGDRMDAHGYNPTTKQILEYTICTDCEYYAEYGQLDDMTMMEMSES